MRRCYKCGEEFVLTDVVLDYNGRLSHFCNCPSEHQKWWTEFKEKT